MNNVLLAQNNGGSQGPNGISLGAGGAGGYEFSNAQVSFIYVYNRVLTTEEITQVYNTHKTRYNL
jgi:shikimate 5-dehydrogenase